MPGRIFKARRASPASSPTIAPRRGGDEAPSPSQYGRAFRAWLHEQAAELAPHRRDPDECNARVANLCALQARLWDAGWAATCCTVPCAHLLAEAHVARAALRSACGVALERLCGGVLDTGLPLLLGALAGRSGRAVAERALQVFGAIGFTHEHPHHRYHRRALTLDALLRSGHELTRELGERARSTGEMPRGPNADDLPGA